MISAKGTNGTVHFDGQTIHIERKGLNARLLVGVGEKRIPIASVHAVQWKNAGMTAGYIQFTISGGSERHAKFGRQSTDAMKDENSVTFHVRQQPQFEEFRAAVEAATTQHVPQPTAAPATAPSIADELTKLAQLRDQGVITPQDFEQAKRQLLGQ